MQHFPIIPNLPISIYFAYEIELRFALLKKSFKLFARASPPPQKKSRDTFQAKLTSI